MNPRIKCEGVFLDNNLVEKAFESIRGNESFSFKPKDYHVTTEYMPKAVHCNLYGQKVIVEAKFYKKDSQLKDKDGNIVGNEGFSVKLHSNNNEVLSIIDRLTRNGKNWHITGSSTQEKGMIYTNDIEFSDGISCDFVFEGIFAGVDYNGNLIKKAE